MSDIERDNSNQVGFSEALFAKVRRQGRYLENPVEKDKYSFGTRRSLDRRKGRVFNRRVLTGRRKTLRRTEDVGSVSTDRPDKAFMALFWGLGILILADMVFTLIHLRAGASEANPLLNMAFQWGGVWAMGVAKMILSAFGLLILLGNHGHRFSSNGVVGLTTVYGLTFMYHVYAFQFLA